MVKHALVKVSESDEPDREPALAPSPQRPPLSTGSPVCAPAEELGGSSTRWAEKRDHD